MLVLRYGLVLMALISSLVVQAESATPQPGEMAPPFVLADANGKSRDLSEWHGRWVVLYFYPRDNTPGCTTEATAFRDHLPELTALQAQVVGISVDSSASHRAFADGERLPFPLLADIDGQVARRYGALTNLAIMKFAKRHTYLIDPDGRIAKAYRDVDPARHASEILADLKRFRAP
jgi:peroxiredoxin Q/BCP